MPVTTSLVVLLLSILTISGLHRHDVHAASAAAAVNYNNEDDELLLLSNIKCSSGWTASAAATVKNEAIPSYIPKSWINSKIPRIPYYIPQSWINDGYCDCPFGNENGMTDEPNTNACSGSKSWPGVMGSSISTRYVIHICKRFYVLRYVNVFSYVFVSVSQVCRLSYRLSSVKSVVVCLVSVYTVCVCCFNIAIYDTSTTTTAVRFGLHHLLYEIELNCQCG